MNQLMIQQEAFPFFYSANVDMGEFLGDLLEYVDDTIWHYEDEIPSQYRHTPSRQLLVFQSMDSFEDIQFRYGMSGCDLELQEEIEELMAEGLQADEIQDRWFEVRDYNLSFGSLTNPSNDYERMFIHDIVRAIDVYHISYFLDKAKDNTRGTSISDMEITGWKNQPIKEVW